MRFLYPFLVLLLLCPAVVPATAQATAQKETFNGLTNRQVTSGMLPAPEHLKDHVAEGKLRLSLDDAIVLTLENNTAVRIQELQVESEKYALLRSHQPFDPFATASFNNQRSKAPAYTQLQGAPTLNSLNQQTQLNYSQTFETGTNFQAGFNVSKQSTNSSFYFFNPYISSGLNLQFTQPLLRNHWLFANRAPIVIARRNLKESQANFAGQVNDAILQVVGQYWNVVEARGNLDVQRKSLDEAETSYKRDKRALELGALPPLDIYRSESEVATRRVQEIQGEYTLKQQEDLLRRTIGADLDPGIRALDLDLTENPEPVGEMFSIAAEAALQQAMARRPELESLRQALANDDTGIRLAHNHLEPELDLTGAYSSNGLGGNQIDPNTGQVTVPGGFSNSLSQLFGFGFPTYSATLSLNFPIRNRSAQADLGNALVSRRQDLYSQRQQQEAIILDVNNAVRQLEQTKLSVTAANVAFDLSKKNLAAEEHKYELGGQTIFFVLNAQSQLAGAEADLLAAQINYQLSLAAVDHATGGLLERYHVKIAGLTH